MPPALYGIKNSNRNFSDPYYWGKNQFNSSFPIALACYMRDSKINPVYVRLNDKKQIFLEYPSFDDIFGTKLSNDKLYFAFESRYEPFEKYVHDELETIDVVIKNAETENFLCPLEIKLTTLPDNTTAHLTDEQYGCEMVIRSATTRYLALSMADSCSDKLTEIRQIFEPVCHDIGDWGNEHEIKAKMSKILNALEFFFSSYRQHEQPLLMQPVWKTIGKSSILADNCLDIFIWSNFALTRLFMDSALENTSNSISRQQRAAIRMARFLFELSTKNKVFQKPIYNGMNLGNQNDKEFAISGNKMNPYLKCDRLTKPIIHKNQIKEIILGDGQKHLSPERRFDAIIYFSTDLFD